MFAVFLCAGPELDSTLKEYYRKAALKEIALRIYEAEVSRFADHLQLKESPDWTAINQIGCMGSYQFTAGTLRRLGYGHITPDRFEADPDIFPPELQKKVLLALIKSNMAILKRYECYIGTTINGTVITRSGLIAAAHLGGAGSVIKYLLTNGRNIIIDGYQVDIHIDIKEIHNASDINGTSIEDYIKEFQGYNI